MFDKFAEVLRGCNKQSQYRATCRCSYLNFQKAFGKVAHNKLVPWKRSHYWGKCVNMDWSLVITWHDMTKINGTLSDWLQPLWHYTQQPTPIPTSQKAKNIWHISNDSNFSKCWPPDATSPFPYRAIEWTSYAKDGFLIPQSTRLWPFHFFNECFLYSCTIFCILFFFLFCMSWCKHVRCHLPGWQSNGVVHCILVHVTITIKRSIISNNNMLYTSHHSSLAITMDARTELPFI